MRVSFEEAFAVLKKWENEETPLCVLVSVNGASFSLSGFIASLDSSSITVSHLTESAEKLGEFLIPFYPFSIFGYREVREATGSIDPRLTSSLQLAGTGMECIFYELKNKNGD
jgi:hypothetical protein